MSTSVNDTAKKCSAVSLTPLKKEKSLFPFLSGVLDTAKHFSTGIKDTAKDF